MFLNFSYPTSQSVGLYFLEGTNKIELYQWYIERDYCDIKYCSLKFHIKRLQLN